VFERFTDYARRVMLAAQDEARQLGHDELGTEHLLLGLTRERESAAAAALEAHGGWHDAVLDEIVVRRGRGAQADPADTSTLPFGRETKRVLELALRESLQLGQSYVGTEHLLLGLLHERGCCAAEVLTSLGVDLDGVRDELVRALGETEGERAPAVGQPPTCPRCGRPLGTSLRSRVLDAPDGDGGPARRAVLLYCGECGISLSGWPAEGD
jgi:ATP-dependent Clp protease ATP-binding subunit ClpC